MMYYQDVQGEESFNWLCYSHSVCEWKVVSKRMMSCAKVMTQSENHAM